MPRRGPTPTLGEHLEILAERFPYARSLPQDPLAQVRRFASDPRAAEIAGVFASTVAVGNVKAIQTSLTSLFRRMGDDPRRFVESFPERRWRWALHPWKHRWIRADQAGFLALRLKEVYARYPGGLEEVFRIGMRALPPGTEATDPAEQFAGGLHALSEALRFGSTDRSPTVYEAPPGYAALFPTPRAPGRPACKREALFVRWMVRSPEPDLGLWSQVPASVLHIPLDTHVYWIARHLGLTRRATRNWPTVVEITDRLRRYDANDPVRFDFVLAHTGISGDCPKRRDLHVCGPCAVRADCDLWRRVKWVAPRPATSESPLVSPPKRGALSSPRPRGPLPLPLRPAGGGA